MNALYAYLNTLPAFAAYFVAAAVLLACFVFIYEKITPYREFQLIHAGNTAAATSLGGAVIGFVLPLASAITHSVGLLDMIVWGVIALVVQLGVFLVMRRVFAGLVEEIVGGRIAPAVMLAAFSVAVGILNAACMVY